MGTTYAQLLQAYLTLVNQNIEDGCPSKWLTYLRAPMACFNRDLDLAKLTFDYNADTTYIYQYHPMKTKTNISLREGFVINSDTAYVYFCRTLNALAISLETSIARAPRSGSISFTRTETKLSINYHWESIGGKPRSTSKNITSQSNQLHKHLIKKSDDCDVYQWLRKSNEMVRARQLVGEV